MKDFVIITDSCADLDKALREKYDVSYVNMRFSYDDKDFPASLDWEALPYKEFYALMRDGKRIKTSQVPVEEYRKAFESALKDGCDVLSVSCSTALSASYNASLRVKEELKNEYPDNEIYCVDALNSCMGLGLLCIWAAKLRSEGLSAAEVYEKLNENKLKMNQFATVEDLNYLKRAGRVKASSAFFGGIFQVKPIIISDAIGQNFAVEKVKGRKTSVDRIVELFAAAYDKNSPMKTIAVSHADDEATADLMVEKLKEKLGDVEIIKAVIGPIVGASVGPGTVCIYGFGDKVTVNMPE
ncbi:MAG: DegV family protein [Clostridia bacterium]|nr:DegV family protein [Clostridia bacterium]